MTESVPYVAALSQRPALHPPKYHVTAVNPLTRQREPVSLPCSRKNAEKMLAKMKKQSPRKRIWKYPRLEVCPPKTATLGF